MLVGVLGILKAGAAYVPLDPKYPPQRLAFVLGDAAAPLLLTQTSLVDQLSAYRGQMVCLDGDRESIRRMSATNPTSGVSADNLAYVIYTSGSTGQPKGVAIEHRSTMALLWWARGVYSSEELAGVLCSTSICFDLSVFEMFLPLSCGGCEILAENILQLPSLSAAGQVSLINSVPSAMAELLSTGYRVEATTVNLAGERLSTELVRRIYQEPSVQRVYELFGPSEDTTYSTWALRSADGPYTV
jgi:microcystin synthetase protein McyA